MKPCEIAVIVPVHNAAAFLTACTDAIAAQKFDAFRCILVDDGSTDGSPALCDAIAAGDQRFVAMHQPNSGVCAARTAGLRRAQELGARWYAFCDADDLYHPELLDTLYAAVTNSGMRSGPSRSASVNGSGRNAMIPLSGRRRRIFWQERRW